MKHGSEIIQRPKTITAEELIEHLSFVPKGTKVFLADPEYGFYIGIDSLHYVQKERSLYLIVDANDDRELPSELMAKMGWEDVDDTEQLDPHAGETIDAEFTPVDTDEKSEAETKVDSLPRRVVREISRFL